MVRSRRVASCSCVPKTLSRRMRPCSSTPRSSPSPTALGPRNVDTSTVSAPHITWTSRKRRPMIRERRNSARTSSGRGVGGDVEVLGSAPEQQVAHGAADDERGVALALQRLRRAQGAGADRIPRDVVLAVGDDLRLRGPEQPAGEDLAEKTGDHLVAVRISSQQYTRRARSLVGQRDDRPPVPLRMPAQGLVRIDGHRVRDALEQRQVVQRVAVEPRLGERSERPAPLREPRLEALHLALAKARGAGHPAGELAVALLGLGRDQMLGCRTRRRSAR